MKAFLFALLAVIGIGFAASAVLEQYQRSVDQAFAGSAARPDAEPKLRDKAPKG